MIAAPLRVGSWPGVEFPENDVLRLLLGGFAEIGCAVRSFRAVPELDPAAVDLLLLHWPEKILWETPRPRDQARNALRLLKALARRPRGVVALWIAHNLAPHDLGGLRGALARPYLGLFSRFLDGAVVLSPGTAAPLAAAYPTFRRRPPLAVWHPAYPDAMLAAPAREAARAALGLRPEHRVLGYCGRLRPYKGLDRLIGAFRGLPRPDARLLLAGRPPDAAAAEALRALAGDDGRILLRFGALEAAAFRDAINACDVFVMPSADYLHSGSIMHALSAGRRILAADTPFARSLVTEAGPARVRLLLDPPGPADLSAALDAPDPDAPPELAAFAPVLAATRIAEFARGLGAQSGPGAAPRSTLSLSRISLP